MKEVFIESETAFANAIIGWCKEVLPERICCENLQSLFAMITKLLSEAISERRKAQFSTACGGPNNLTLSQANTEFAKNVAKSCVLRRIGVLTSEDKEININELSLLNNIYVGLNQ
jgi:hypothetical protein